MLEGAQAREWSLMSTIALLMPSSDLPGPQTHIFPRVSRLPGAASFTLHRKGDKGGSSHPAWPTSAQCLGPWAGPASPSRPEALAVLGHLWLPVETGQEATWALGSQKDDTQGRRHGMRYGAYYESRGS